MPVQELTLDELRRCQVGILAELDRWCRRHGVTYYLAYGTLLGAARHRGFIPWDDDVDVMMARADFDRLVRELPATGPAHLSVASATARPEWPLPYAKVCDDRTVLREPLADPVEMGVNVDVFPVDPLPARRSARAVQALLLRLLRWAVELHYIDPRRGRGWHGPVAIHGARPLLRLLPVRVLVAATTRVARFQGAPSDRVGVRVGSYDWSVPRQALGEPVDLPFEGLTCLAPADTDAVLRALYGDYRVLPPEGERTSQHAFVAYRRTTADPVPPLDETAQSARP